MIRAPRAVAALPTFAVLLVLGACPGGKLPLPDGEVEPPMSVDRIRDRPDEFVGERVRLTASLAEPHGNRVFTLKDDDPMLKEQLLVVTRRPLPQLLAEEQTTLRPGDQLLVTGVIRRGDLAAIESELGVELDPKLENRFRDTPVLVASEVVRTGSKEPDPPDTLGP